MSRLFDKGKKDSGQVGSLIFEFLGGMGKTSRFAMNKMNGVNTEHALRASPVAP